MSVHNNLAKNAAAGAILGGGLLFTAGLGMAGAQPTVPAPEGSVDIAVGDVTILQGVPSDTAAVTAGALCGTAPEDVSALAQQGTSENVAQTVCVGLPGGDLTLAPTANTAEAEQPSGTDGTEGTAEDETTSPGTTG